jgi:hypothetical protein
VASGIVAGGVVGLRLWQAIFRKKKRRKSVTKPKSTNRGAREKLHLYPVRNFCFFSIIFLFSLKIINFQLSQPWICGAEIPQPPSSVSLKADHQLGLFCLFKNQIFYYPQLSVFTNTNFSDFISNYYEKVRTSKYSPKSPPSFIWSSSGTNYTSFGEIYVSEFRSPSRIGVLNHTIRILAPSFPVFGHIYASPCPFCGCTTLNFHQLCHRRFLISTMQHSNDGKTQQDAHFVIDQNRKKNLAAESLNHLENIDKNAAESAQDAYGSDAEHSKSGSENPESS